MTNLLIKTSSNLVEAGSLVLYSGDTQIIVLVSFLVPAAVGVTYWTLKNQHRLQDDYTPNSSALYNDVLRNANERRVWDTLPSRRNDIELQTLNLNRSSNIGIRDQVNNIQPNTFRNINLSNISSNHSTINNINTNSLPVSSPKGSIDITDIV